MPEIPAAIERLDTYEADGTVWARTTGLRRRQGSAAAALVRRQPPLLRGGRGLPGAQARALRSGDLRPRRRPPRVRRTAQGDRRDARLRPRPGRGAALPARAPDAGRRAGEDVQAQAATSCSSTTSSTRSASTSRAGSWSTAATTRRSRSTSTSRPRSRARTPSTTCNTSTRGSTASFARRRRRRGRPGAAAGAGDEERELVKRLAEFPGVVREATERRDPHAIPVYAIRVADDFHRFYHDHIVLASKGGEHESFRLALDRRDPRRDRAEPGSDRRRRAGADVGGACPSGSPSRPWSPPRGRCRRRSRSTSGASTPATRGQHRADAKPAGLGGAGPDARVRRVHARARRSARRRARGRPRSRCGRARPCTRVRGSGCATARRSRAARSTSRSACRRSRRRPSTVNADGRDGLNRRGPGSTLAM